MRRARDLGRIAPAQSVGTSRRSSSNQFWTTMSCDRAASPSAVSVASAKSKKRCPSGDTAIRRLTSPMMSRSNNWVRGPGTNVGSAWNVSAIIPVGLR